MVFIFSSFLLFSFSSFLLVVEFQVSDGFLLLFNHFECLDADVHVVDHIAYRHLSVAFAGLHASWGCR